MDVKPRSLLPNSIKVYQGAYLSAQRLLWVRRGYLTKLAKGTYAKTFVKEERPFISRTTQFVTSGAYEELRMSGFTAIREQYPDVALADCGPVLVGKSDWSLQEALLWIGIAPSPRIAWLSITDRAFAMRARVTAAPEVPSAIWTSLVDNRYHLRDRIRGDGEQFRGFARAILREACNLDESSPNAALRGSAP